MCLPVEGRRFIRFRVRLVGSAQMSHGIMASSVTSEAVVFRGCTRTELVVMFVASLIIWVPVCCFLASTLVNNMFLGLGFSLIATFVSFLCCSLAISRVKRNAPEGQYAQKIEVFLHKSNLKKYYFFIYDGEMSCLLYTSPSPRDRQKSRMPSSA